MATMRNFEITSNKSKAVLKRNLYLSSKFLSYSKANIVHVEMLDYESMQEENNIVSPAPDFWFVPAPVLDTGLVVIRPLITTVCQGLGFPPRGSTTMVL